MKPKSTLRSFLSIASSAVLTTSYSQAATLYWDGASASWNTVGNWSTASGATTPDPAAVPGTLDDAIFNNTGVDGAQSITLDANQAIRSLTFNNTGTSTLLGGGTARTLTLGTGGITMAASAGAVTLGDGTAANDVFISLTNGTRTWTNNSAANFTINNSAASVNRVAGATLGFNKVGAGDFSMSTTVLPNTNDIVGAWAFFGTGGTQRYAFNNAGTIAEYTGGTAAADANAFASATANYDLTSAAITLTGNRTANTFRSAGAGGITDLGAAGTNTLTANGILAVGSGTLTINRTGGTGTVVIGASNELVIAGSQAVTINAPISGAAKSLTYSGTSTLTLNAATFTGGLNVNSGTLTAAFAPTYTSANVAAGATWNYINAFGNNPSFTNPFTINGSFLKTGNGGMTFNSGATISGSGLLSFTGQVTIAINSDNPNFTGTISEASQGGSGFNIGHNGALGAGLLVFGNNSNDIRSTVGGGYVAAYNSTYRFDASRTFGGNGVNLDFGAGAVTLNSNPTITVSNSLTTFGGAIGQTGGTRTLGKAGTGTLVLGGSTSNTYGGLTSVTAGTMQLNKSGTANAIGAGGLSVGSGTTVTYTGASTDMIANAGPVTVTGTGVMNLNGVSDTIGTLGLTAVAANNALVTTGAGILTLGGNVTFTAATTGRAQISGNLNLGAATRTFSVGAGTGIGHDLLINAPITGSVGLTKTGTGRLSLSGANSYIGLTTVTDGTLRMTAPSSLGNGGLTVAAAKSFIYAPTTAGALDLGSGAVTLASGATLGTALGGTTGQSAITSTGAASLTGTGTVNIHLIPGTAPAVGTHNLITATSGLDGGTFTLGAVYNNTDFTLSNFTRTAGAISVDVSIAAPLSGGVFWKGGLAGNTAVWSASNGSTTSNWQVTDGVNQPIAPGATSDLIFSAATSPGTMAGMTLGASMTIRTLTINNTATAFGLGGTDGTLTITPASSSTGINIGAGVQASSISVPISLGAPQTWTNNSVNALSILGGVNNNGHTLTLDGIGSFSFDNVLSVISGAGGIIKNGSGSLILSAGSEPAHSFTGAITLNGGSIKFQTSATFTRGNTLITDGYLAGRFSSSPTWSGLGTGTNQIQITGGTSGFSGEGSSGSTFTIGTALSTLTWGSTFFNPSVLIVGGVGPNTAASGSLNNGIDLNGVNRTMTSTLVTDNTSGRGFAISGVINNSSGTAAGLTKTGVASSNLILNGANTFNGTTTFTAGFLTLGNALALQNSALDTTASIAGSGTAGLRTTVTTLTLGGLTGNKNFAATGGIFTSATGGYGSVTALTLNPAAADNLSYTGNIENGAAGMNLAKNGLGTQILSGTNSYSGTTTVSAGTLAGTNATQSFGTNLSGISLAAAGTLSLRNDSSVSFTNGTSAYNIANSAPGATINVDRVTGTGTNILTVGNLTTTSTAAAWGLTFTGANGVSLNAGTLNTPVSTAASQVHTITNNIAGGGSLTLASVFNQATTVASPDLAVAGTGTTIISGAITQTLADMELKKSGAGTLLLNGTNTYTGLTTVSAGTLGGTGSIAGNVTVAAAGSLAPGASAGTLSIGGVLNISLPANGGTGKLKFELGPIAASDKIALTGSGSLTIGGNFLGFSDFTFSTLSGLQNGTYKLITSANAISGGLDTTPANLTGPIGAGTGTLQITGNDVELVVSGIGAGSAYDTWATSKGLTGANNGKGDNPDNDGLNNLGEFAFDGNPLSGANDGKIVGKVATVSAAQVMTLTLPVRNGASFSASSGDQLSALIDDIYYRIEGDVSLSPFADTITEVTGGDATAIQTGLPALTSGWTYRTFRAPGTVPATPKAFLRAKISETP